MNLPLSADEVELTLLPLERATQLPPRSFTDPGVLAWELQHVFRRGWIGACHIDQLAGRGRYVMIELGGESVLVVADEDGLPRAFVNSCRHRGSRIVDSPEGTVRRLQCPYHAWAYGFDGTLRNAPFTEGLEDFDRACFGLKPVRLAVVEGLVLLDLSGEAPSPAEHVGDLREHLAHHRLQDLRRGARIVYEVEANWKLIAENYSECLHCPGVHPELNRLSHYLSGESVTGPGAWCGGSMTLSGDAETMAREGGINHRPPIRGLSETDLRSVYYYLLFPNVLVSLHPDYVMLHTLWPRAADRTEVVCEWYFERATMVADAFDPQDAVDFWDQVNREDWDICALNHRGLRNRDASAGRYTIQEGDVHGFDVMVAGRYLTALRAELTS
ncbi:MAG TPA: aromatic ring-hydroxylating dioxygenase subunit alpha [Solirubrobacteraceae bacterium]|nr:aromatic ring-hydroxylating dioxygenase subunit alpha [Solirubrobacteraceae bacterium]